MYFFRYFDFFAIYAIFVSPYYPTDFYCQSIFYLFIVFLNFLFFVPFLTSFVTASYTLIYLHIYKCDV